MARKGIISKAKLISDLNAVIKRGKIAGRAAVHGLALHHHAAARPDEYEFSCSSSPAYFGLPFHLGKRRRAHAPSIDGELETVESAEASPALPGFGRTPVVRQLRIADSPFPASWDEGSYPVDEAAEEFIMRFYRDLRRQNDVAQLGCA
ncbi:Unknown protein [Striga hermonthica]|uniref:Avr9/Cf-9 rapidly elicited protein 146 n=1 Tax=Striga hermonthica TaxID=68872 RepID=A0A9N7NW13_STRHE|nr:Unknown protein [Striga hermonthica]